MLESAWRKVRDHAQNSKSYETKQAAALFDKDPYGSIDRLQKRLAKGKFQFSPQRGIPKRKTNSSTRPLVVAPLEDRIIQRAILEVLISHVRAVKEIMSTRTSIGGIPGRGTRHALELITNAIDQGASYFIRSDIEGFFMRIPKPVVKAFVAKHVKDKEFLGLFDGALNTELENLDQLGEYKMLFPVGDEGVAQGSALSTLAGNIVLKEFDDRLNGQNITCVRYIDDYILLGPGEGRVNKAFESSQRLLKRLNMNAYSPWETVGKAEHGRVTHQISFLGCEINPSQKLIQPSKKNRRELLRKIRTQVDEALRNLQQVNTVDQPPKVRQRYAQTLVKIDGIISGWGHAFQFSNCGPTFDSLDHEIDKLLQKFNTKVKQILQAASPRVTRRLLGVQLLQDIPAVIRVGS